MFVSTIGRKAARSESGAYGSHGAHGSSKSATPSLLRSKIYNCSSPRAEYHTRAISQELTKVVESRNWGPSVNHQHRP
jgi:hypothetical protein